MILDRAAEAIRRYNQSGLHWNLVAEGIYQKREAIDPFSEECEPHLVAGLIAFDMERMMGQGDKYDPGRQSFRSRLRAKMRTVRERIRVREIRSARACDTVGKAV